ARRAPGRAPRRRSSGASAPASGLVPPAVSPSLALRAKPTRCARGSAAWLDRIAGSTPGMKVSWQLTGVRQDAYANAHRIPVEELEPARERGTPPAVVTSTRPCA